MLCARGALASERKEAMAVAHEGNADCVVATAAGATDAETYAAKELADYLGKITGAVFRIVGEGEATSASHRVFVGWTDFAAEHKCDASRLGDEEWIIRTVGQGLIITGGRPRGTLYGVYEFLERELDCHWLDESTEVVPKSPDLTLGKVNRRGQPAFWMRAISGGYYSIESGLYGKDQPYRARNKVNGDSSGGLGAKFGFTIGYGSPGGCHTFGDYAKKFPADRPEYLSMNPQGKRIGAADGSGPGGICLMHPEVRKLVLARLREFILADRQRCAKAGTPPPRVYDISQNDNHWMCQCPDCKAMSAREGSESGPVIDFINEIADGIRTEYPDIFVQTFAYSITEQPPKTLRPRDNVIIRIAELNAEWGRESDLFHPITHKSNRAQLQRLQGWSRIARNLSEWDYWIQYSPNDKFPTPYAPIRCIPPDLATFHKNHVSTIYVECEDPERTSFYALKRWLGFQLMQNPRQAAEPLLKMFFAGYYGPAAAKMREYLRFLENSIAAVDANMSAVKNYARPYLTLPFYLTCERLLDEAEALCASDAKALLHVRRERLPVDAGLYHTWTDLTLNVPAEQRLPFDREFLLKRYEPFRLEQMAAFRTAEGFEKGRQQLAEEIGKMQDFVLLDQRKQQPPRKASIPNAPDSAAQGDPTKVDWSKAVALDGWLTVEGFSTDQKPTGYLIHDGAHLYVKLEHACDATKLESAEQIWSGDDWEMFFAARRQPPYRQLGINARGESFAYDWEKLIGKCNPTNWASGARIVSRPQADRWTVLVSIPLENLVPVGVKQGVPLYANFCRIMRSPTQTLLTWTPNFDNNFHVLTRLGELRPE